MVNIKPVLLIIGTLLSILSVAMIIPALVDYYNNNASFSYFTTSAFITAFFGFSLIIPNNDVAQQQKQIDIKTAFLITSMSWVSMGIFASLPLYLSEVGNGSFTDAFFEGMSGLTTTGATIMTNLQGHTEGILLWRSILQWLGGVGIIVMAMSLLPLLKIGGMQLFRTESSDNTEKVLPRATQVAGAVTGLYVTLTFVCFLLMWNVADISVFDAICHAMTTVATGGFSNYDESIGYFKSASMETIVIIFIILSALPYALFIKLYHGKAGPLLKDSQVRFFLGLVLLSVMIATTWLRWYFDISFWEAFRKASFNITSILTTTGYSTSDYYHWGSFMVIFVYLICVIGGCTGSTTGGIKAFRYYVVIENTKAQIYKLIHPHGVFRPKFNGHPISDEATNSVISYLVLFVFCFTIIAILLAMTGLDYTTSMSGSAAMLANLGPGLGDIIGPAGNYSTFSNFAKWVCTAGMVLGRLEIFTIFVILSPYFWRN